MGLLGGDDGGFGMFAGLASICLFQAVYPTLLGWLIVTAIYCIFSGAYLYASIGDLVELARGHQPSIFLNPTDAVVFASLVVVLLAVGIAVIRHPPKYFAT